MKRSAIAAVAMLAAVTAVAWAGDFTWVSSDGETFDLSQLADGETKRFQAGDRELTATRRGDVVVLARDGEELDATCDLSTDSCRIGTAGNRFSISVTRESECEGQACNSFAHAYGDLALINTDGPRVTVERICEGDACSEAGAHGFVVTNCEGDECSEMTKRVVVNSCSGDDCDVDVQVLRDGGSENAFVIDLQGGPHGEEMSGFNVFSLSGLLGRKMVWKAADDIDGCPDGYRTMRFTDETAEDGYLCVKPKRRPGDAI